MEDIRTGAQVHEHSLVLQSFRMRMNDWVRTRTPFIFLIDFELQKPLIIPMDEVNPADILFDFDGLTNAPFRKVSLTHGLSTFPPDFSSYEKKFQQVMTGLAYGDTFLTNLTIRTPGALPASLPELFHASHAKFRLWYRDHFLVFSPESFVNITGDTISSFPMKGTIDASIPDARKKILEDRKEMAEHVTIVDLIRNDLSTIAADVHVARFRFIDTIRTRGKDLLQVSSEVSGKLLPHFREDLGGVLLSLLPAGSVSGAPKDKTLEIIRKAEGEERGYYTGVCGCYDGHTLKSAVMIRYIEQQGEHYFYRSGGGITTQSEVRSEYNEAIDKIYVPID